jgi:glutaconate CoA-transferase subunit B
MLVSLHPAVRLEEVVDNTGFRLQIPTQIPATPLPTAEDLRLLRREIDPGNIYLR